MVFYIDEAKNLEIVDVVTMRFFNIETKAKN